MGNSLLLVGAKLGMDVRDRCAKASAAAKEHIKPCEGFAKESGCRITVTDDPGEGVKGGFHPHRRLGVDGEPIESWGERIGELMPFQVNAKHDEAAANPRVRFMHCLPAFHNPETKVGQADRRAVPPI